MIRHICNGHEYRFDPKTGQVINNYGTVKSVLLFHMFTSSQCPYVASLYPARADGTADTRTNQGFAAFRSTSNPSDEKLAQFAIGHTAANFKED